MSSGREQAASGAQAPSRDNLVASSTHRDFKSPRVNVGRRQGPSREGLGFERAASGADGHPNPLHWAVIFVPFMGYCAVS